MPKSTQPNTISIQDIDVNALDALISRLQEAKDYQLTLEAEDIDLLIMALVTLAQLQHKLSEQDITLHKLRKLLGIVRSSERLKALLPEASQQNNDTNSTEIETSVDLEQTRKQPKKRHKKPKLNQDVALPPSKEYHTLTELKRGDRCPECLIGTLSKYEPSILLRISGENPYQMTRHIMERLRCNACGIYFTAPLSDDVKLDGHINQMYGYSARTMMALSKYYMGQPFFRQDSLQAIFGVRMTASSISDQCEYLYNSIDPVYQVMIKLGANATAFEIDDTPNQILNATETEKPNRKTGKMEKRTGTYTSALIATLESGQNLTLLQTNIGHAGEWIDEVLSYRTPNLPAPLVMSDASSNNRVYKSPVISCLCNAHARRKFADIVDYFPDTVPWVLKKYAKIWEHDTVCQERNFSPTERLKYHKEHSLPVMTALKERFESDLGQEIVEENSVLGSAMKYFLNHYQGLKQFCCQPSARLDNNRLETQLKIPIRNRKNAYFYKTEKGASMSDCITSMIAICMRSGVNPFNYLTWLQQQPERVNLSPELCLPWNYNTV